MWLPMVRRLPTAHEAHHLRVRHAVGRAISDQIHEYGPAVEMLDEVHERLTECEHGDNPLYRPIRESVEEICDALGLKPDWSRWTDDGFAPHTEGRHYNWENMWAPNPGRRRAAKAAKLSSA